MNIAYIAITLLLFLFGGIIMGLEILSSSLMAPYFGGSVYVWSSIISAFMVHMALGYLFGGYLAKRTGRLSVLAWVLGIGSILTILIPVVHRPLCEYISEAILDIRFGSLAAMMIISLPVLAMAMVSPFIIGFVSTYKQHSGISAGLILSASTFGSFLGTNLTAFYLIDLFPVSKIITTLGVAGLVMATLLFILNPDKRLSSATLIHKTG